MTRPLRCNICEASIDPELDAAWTKDGLKILRCPGCGLLFRADQPRNEGTFDCVTMWDYTEHTIDRLCELQLARKLLRPGGVLALSTGDAGALVTVVARSRTS